MRLPPGEPVAYAAFHLNDMTSVIELNILFSGTIELNSEQYTHPGLDERSSICVGIPVPLLLLIP